MVESAAHRESVKNKIHSQRIRRLIQTGINLIKQLETFKSRFS